MVLCRFFCNSFVSKSKAKKLRASVLNGEDYARMYFRVRKILASVVESCCDSVDCRAQRVVQRLGVVS